MLEAGKAWRGQEGYLQCRGACLQPMYCCLKGLTPLLLPVNGILEGLEGKAGLEGQLAGAAPETGHPAGGSEMCHLSQHCGTLIQAFISSSDLGTKGR